MSEPMSDERWEELKSMDEWSGDTVWEVAAEIDRLRAENAALTARLAEAERLVKICRKCIDSEDISVYLDSDLDDFIATIRPPTAKGGTT